MWKVIVKEKFSAAHYLESYKGKKEPLHGHNYTVEVYIRSERIDDEGIAYDFHEVKEYLKNILPNYRFLNEIYEFPTTTENIAREIYNKVKQRYPNIEKVIVWENEDMGVEYGE